MNEVGLNADAATELGRLLDAGPQSWQVRILDTWAFGFAAAAFVYSHGDLYADQCTILVSECA